ncbi:CAP domain-containing protein [Patescibacteria group bacterium]
MFIGVIISLMEPNSPKKANFWRKNVKSIEKYQFVHRFLPHEEEQRRSKFLSNGAMFLYCVFVFSITVTFRFLPKLAPGILGYASNINVSDLLSQTNQKRAEKGLPPLRLNSTLSEAAKRKAYHMFENDYWSHISPDGTEPWDFILGQGYDYIYAGENLAKNFSSSKQVVEGWYNSPTHKSNLLGSNYDEIGFAVVNGTLDGYETTLVVQMFGRPRDRTQIASVLEEEELLEEVSVLEEVPEPVMGTQITVNPQEVEPTLDVTKVSRSMSLTFGGFVGSLLALDVWYSKKKGIKKFTGHTFAHLTILLMVIVSIWFVFKPGLVL